ncbi:MAG: hypothetical protein J5X23_12590 [Candidatus Accumulibacter sp.]|uniref:hypothetical protein n=1 Tax=Accumulibacter sp. TaxID=2053492 RepID=UPI001B009F18|nr:hypothetical protein [Accumulibacter sp.]MBO3715792.1 hypothetical protein [Accumulibacter sp.]
MPVTTERRRQNAGERSRLRHPTAAGYTRRLMAAIRRRCDNRPAPRPPAAATTSTARERLQQGGGASSWHWPYNN